MITEIKVGDYIEKSELDTEQKYNDVVEVFEQCGFPPYLNHGLNKGAFCCLGSSKGLGLVVACKNTELDYSDNHSDVNRKRKLTYNDIMPLKKVDWNKAPGATIYAAGKFWKQNERTTYFVDEFHLGSGSFLPTAATVDKLKEFDDFEIKPDVNLLPYQTFKGEIHGDINLKTDNITRAHKKPNEVVSNIKDGKKYHQV